jgi:hypothetical protein
MKNIVLIVIAFLLLSCGSNSSKPYQYKIKGIQFIVPENWKIEKESEPGNHNYYIQLHRRGLNVTGSIYISIFKDTLDRFNLMDTFKKAMVENPKANGVTYRFSEPKDSLFGIHASICREFTADAINAHLVGTLRCFHICNQTVYVLRQSDPGELKKNNPGFETFEKSVSCNQ